MLNCNYYVAASDYDSYYPFLDDLKQRYSNLQIFYAKESLIKSIEFLSQSQPYIDNNMFIVFTEAALEHGISKYLKENLDELNYIVISFGGKKERSENVGCFVFDYIETDSDLQDNSIVFHRLKTEIFRKSKLIFHKLRIREFYEIGKLLSSEKDILKLFDIIISTSMKITSSDAVTLYLVADKETGEWSSIDSTAYDSKLMKFVVSKNQSSNTDFQTFTIPITKRSITGYTAINGKSIRINDAYHIAPEMEYKHDSSFDRISNYRTVSMLSVPMKDRNDNVVGVIQLINKKREASMIDYSDNEFIGNIIPYDYFDELTMNSIAGQAAVALENNLLYKNINQLLQRYVEQNEKLTVLSGKILKAHEEERKRIAREIHDGPAQSAASLALKLELCKRQLQNHDYDKLSLELDKLGEYVRSNVKEMRTIIYDLKPSYLDDGFFAAVQNHISVYCENTNLKIQYETIGNDSRIEYYIVSTLFRVVQEALNNISKHAKATEISIKIEVQPKKVFLDIVDNGKGFDAAKLHLQDRDRLSGGFGIEGMRERVELIHGKIDIVSSIGNGTTIKIVVPIE